MTTFLAGMKPTATQLEALANHGKVTAFTPSWTNVTLGSGAVNEGRYVQIGDLVFWWFRTQFGTSPAFSTTIQLTLPVTALAGGGNGVQATVGAWTFRDASAGDHWSGSIGLWSSAGTLASFAGAWNGTAPKTRIGTSGAPVTVAVDDVLSGSGHYPVL